tara:strand:+ start:10352 stop:10729 length:378 start_codon:yes stop_codon:yes gene_type:complete
MADFKEMPQPKTFAPSKEDVLQNLQYFFGAPVSPEKLKDYSEHHAMTYHFPDAYAGQNTKIRDTLNNLILKSPQNWRECRPLENAARPRTRALTRRPLPVPRRDERRAALLPNSGHCRRMGRGSL